MTKTTQKSLPMSEQETHDSSAGDAQTSSSRRMAQHSSTFGFFAKYQRIILYTAGIFALVSFSITGALQSMFSDMFRDPILLDTIEVSGRTVKTTEQDQRIATELARRSETLDPAVVLPNLRNGDRNQDMGRIFAALRRAAITYEIEVSELEIDRAIQEGIATFPANPALPINTPADMAAQLGYSSLEAYRTIVREAMRIGTFVRLQSLAIDAADYSLVSELLEQQEMIKLTVASMDKQALEEELKKTAVSDADLQKWIDDLSDVERRINGYVDSTRAKLRLVSLKLDGVDLAPFAEELGERVISDEEIQQHYQQNRELLYKLPEPEKKPAEDSPVEDPPAGEPQVQDPPAGDGYEPLDDALKAKIKTRIEAREIMRALWAKVQKEQGDALLPLNETRTIANQSRLEAQELVTAAQVSLDASPDDEALKQARDDAQTQLEAAEKTHDDAGEAIDAARAAFDMAAAFRRVLGDRDAAAFSFIDSGDKPESTEDLGELPELGTWAQAWAGTSHQKLGELSSSVQETKTALFHYSVTELEINPLKPFAEIKDEANADYYAQQADEQGKTKSDAFEAALLRLASELRADEVTALESAKTAELDSQVAAWQTATNKKRDDAQTQVDQLSGDQESGAYKRWRSYLDDVLAELGDSESKRSSLDESLSEKLEADIKEEARKAYKDVLDAAAAEAGFTVEELEFRPRNLNSKGSAKGIFPASVQFLFFDRSSVLAGLEEGDPTDLLEDATNRRTYLAVCVAEEPATLASLTRRDLVQGRAQAAQARITAGMAQSFSVEALKARLGLKGPEDTPEIKTSAPEPKKEEKQDEDK